MFPIIDEVSESDPRSTHSQIANPVNSLLDQYLPSEDLMMKVNPGGPSIELV